MKIEREATKELLQLSKTYRAVVITGPRQSGKTTLVRSVFPNKTYVNLENPDYRNFAISDPRGFLDTYSQGAILDEIQRVPELFSYLQQCLDETNERGFFILTGSNNFLLQEQISQSLAGRVGYLFLLPLSITELKKSGQLIGSIDDMLLRGGYPELYNQPQIISTKYYSNYILTYLERDVRQLKNISNSNTFERFLRLVAGRVGQLLNMNSLAVEVGVDNKTIAAWLSVLEASFVVFRLYPYHKNFNKRLVKMPKLYFYDVAIATRLLGIEDKKQLSLHPFRGALFENLIILELLKHRFNLGESSNLYFWRDHTGNEIDVIMEKGGELVPIELKSGKTVTSQFFKGLTFWQKLTKIENGVIVYGGDVTQNRSNGIKIASWKVTEDYIGI